MSGFFEITHSRIGSWKEVNILPNNVAVVSDPFLDLSSVRFLDPSSGDC